jgi:hypothetical protein
MTTSELNIEKLCDDFLTKNTITSDVAPKINTETNVKDNTQKVDMSSKEYNDTIFDILSVAKSIKYTKEGSDGRIDSAVKEEQFLTDMKNQLLKMHPDWKIEILPPRSYCDIIVNSIRINLKLSNCRSSDNSVNKKSIYYSITGLTNYLNTSNWNDFFEMLTDAKTTNQIKKQRNKHTELHFLVKNKITGYALLKPIFDIHTYVHNASNDLQINWKNEFENLEYQTKDDEYSNKVQSLLSCIQTSVKQKIDTTKKFAEADIKKLFI